MVWAIRIIDTGKWWRRGGWFQENLTPECFFEQEADASFARSQAMNKWKGSSFEVVECWFNCGVNRPKENLG